MKRRVFSFDMFPDLAKSTKRSRQKEDELRRTLKAFPDRDMTAPVSVSAIIGHEMLNNTGLHIDLFDKKLQKDIFERQVPDKQQRRVGNPLGIYEVDGGPYRTVADSINNSWEPHFRYVLPDMSDTRKLAGAYTVSTTSAHTLVIGRTPHTNRYIDPLLDSWSREAENEHRSNIIVLDERAEHFMKFHKDFEKRGYDVHLLNLFNEYGDAKYNPFQIAINAVRQGDYTKCAMYVNNAISSLLGWYEENGDPFHGGPGAYVYSALIYSLISDALYQERVHHKPLVEAWSKVTLKNCYEILKQGFSAFEETCKHGLDVSVYDYKALIKNAYDAVIVWVGDNDERKVDVIERALKLYKGYNNPVYETIMSANIDESLDVEKFAEVSNNKPMALFVGETHHLSVGMRIFETLIWQITNYTFSCVMDKSDYRGTKYILDDDVSFGGITNDWESILSLGMLCKQEIVMMLPSLSSLKRCIFGDNGGNIKELVDKMHVVFLKSSDDETAYYLAERAKKSREYKYDKHRLTENFFLFMPVEMNSMVIFTADGYVSVASGENVLPLWYSYLLKKPKYVETREQPESIFTIFSKLQ